MEQENAKAIEIPTQQNIYLFLADLKMCYIESSFIAKTIFVFFFRWVLMVFSALKYVCHAKTKQNTAQDS